MMRRFSGSATPVAPIALVLAVLATLLVPAVAQATTKQYVLKHPKHEHCKAHYVKKNEKIKKREYGRTVKVREIFCVYVAPKAPAKATTPVTTTPAPTTPTPSTPAAVPRVTPYAHLDPSFTQSPSNPLAVTYSYSASATETINGVTSPASNLPSGVLNLYSDGLLKCSINVGGSTTGGECPVTYSAIGSHTVITTYTSGTLSSTETYVERIEPFPAAATQTTLHTTLIGCEEEVRGEGNENGHERTNTEHRCNYRVEAASSEPEQQITLLVGPRGEYDDPLALSITNGGSCTLTATNWTLISYPL